MKLYISDIPVSSAAADGAARAPLSGGRAGHAVWPPASAALPPADDVTSLGGCRRGHPTGVQVSLDTGTVAEITWTPFSPKAL